jgi:hypothetical protein
MREAVLRSISARLGVKPFDPLRAGYAHYRALTPPVYGPNHLAAALQRPQGHMVAPSGRGGFPVTLPVSQNGEAVLI